MCGINGIIIPGSGNEYTNLVSKMNEALKHRGPDDAGVFSSHDACIGQRRLSIIDLSEGGHQPMVSNDGNYVIVYNGELYNFKEIKLDLQRSSRGSSEQPYHFKTNSDTEVILAAYIRWGKNCLQYFNGMFAFAIYNIAKGEVFIARDRMGIKPLYYYADGNRFSFSSELKPLLLSLNKTPQLNLSAFNDYIRYQTVHAPETLVKNVFMLMPGHYITITKANYEITQYWNLNDFVEQKPKTTSYTQACSDVRNLLEKAVERRLIADVPFGAFLSGGIDSSAVVALMSRVSGQKVKTFSVVFDDPNFSEAKYARMIADKYNTDHHEIMLNANHFRDELVHVLQHTDFPGGDGPNTYVVSKATRQAGITMALSGLGGDELFAGYDIFKRSLKLSSLSWIGAVPGKSLAGKILQILKPGISSDKINELLQLNSFGLKYTYPFARSLYTEDVAQKLLGKNSLNTNQVAKIVSQIPALKNKIISAVSVAEMSTYMQNVLLRDTDQMSMAHALEVRVPFLDYNLVEYVLTLPDQLKYPATPKKLLVDAMGDLLPPEIVNRPKMGFTLPWAKWMKEDLRPLTEQSLISLQQMDLLDQNELKNIWQKFTSGDPRISWSRIWYLVVLSQWLQNTGLSNSKLV